LNLKRVFVIINIACLNESFGGFVLKFKKVKRTTIRKKTKPDIERSFKREVSGVILFAFALLIWFAFAIEGSVGAFGNFLTSFLLGFLGIPAFFVSYIMMFFSVLLILGKPLETIRSKLNGVLILLTILSALIHTGVSDSFASNSFFGNLKDFFQMGRLKTGGGVMGGLISTPFLKVFQSLGTIIILMTLATIDIMVLTDVSLLGVWGRLAQAFRKVFWMTKRSLAKIGKIDWSSLRGFFLRIRHSLFKKRDKFFSEVQNPKAQEKSLLQTVDSEIKNDIIHFADEDIHTEISKSHPNPQNIIPFQTKLQKQEALSEDGVPSYSLDFTKEEGTNRFVFPDISLLNQPLRNPRGDKDTSFARENKRKLEETLQSFGVEAKVGNVTVGPAVTQYEIIPAPGVKVSKIVGLSDDISLNLATSGIRMEAPIPGKSAIGIEVPNKDTTPVLLRDVISSEEFFRFPSKLAFALGKDISGEKVVADIAKMPHLLIAGATGAGKSVCINSLIISLLYKATPEEVKLLMIDPKVVELGIYNGIPHLLIPVVTDPKKAAGALNWAVVEMASRYKAFADKGVRDIGGFNHLMRQANEETLPHIVIIIDELADLMMVAPGDVEDAICRLAQMARAAGMHLVIATQRPSVDVITGIIKANIPSRIAFAVTSQVDSRTILDMGGAEKLLGKGDMLFYPVGEAKPKRVKGSFVSDKEVEKVVEFVKNQKQAQYNEDIAEQIKAIPVGDGKSRNRTENVSDDSDPLLQQVIECIVTTGQASASLIQRKFKVGYARAARIMDQLEEKRIIGEFEGSKPRQILITKQDLMELSFHQEP
jgi:DNA segregation ATPase FtsK/SpoIIIE, S-DNA-T family